ncbi:glycosyl transferase [Sphingobacterium sp. KB22]|uniref:Glycosyl transferase n=2 Tax=Sphingobacterium hungaricum TaxID=2082723 RepID=A0A928UXA1_9SPHI|nr:glycosyltransferase [Sphingobacterium hungaricum]MBE8713673.1 glycosyl transferase [Sphingobacterium hungaricum]
MAIPKTIYQTFKTSKIPWITKLYIWIFMKKNKSYSYEFYDDQRIEKFMEENFDQEVYQAYSKLQIGAAKADFFRYAVLYIHGGIYLDLDSDILTSLDKFIREDDVAVITREKRHQEFFAQWALIYEKGHPFLARTIEYIVDNINQKRHLHDVHALTGPTIYTKAINDCLAEDPSIPHRIVEDDYKGMMQFKYKFGKIFIYGDRKLHWKKLQKQITVIKED